ncbi:MAG: AMP-binding protein [Acidimicrobiia bacterium]
MSKYLRTFLYDSTYECTDKLIENIKKSWENHDAISLIPLSFPKNVVDELIVKLDPNEVINLRENTSYVRDLAIVENEDLAAVVFTSGTISQPKPVELTFSAMENSVNSIYEYCRLDKNDSWMCVLPLHYIAGLSILARCFISGSQFLHQEKFDAEFLCNEISLGTFSAISLMPSQLKELMKYECSLESLKAILIGGSHIDDQLLEQCAKRQLNVYWTYGMTETFGGICINGDFLQGTTPRIIDSILQIKSKSLMSGYRHEYSLTNDSFTNDGYFITKDRAEIIDGRLNILGRLDDVIISGGIKIDLIDLERIFKSKLNNLDFVLFPNPHDKLGSCLSIGIKKSQAVNLNIKNIRDTLRDLVPATHLPIRLYSVDDEYFDGVLKISRNKASESAELVDQYEI